MSTSDPLEGEAHGFAGISSLISQLPALLHAAQDATKPKSSRDSTREAETERTAEPQTEPRTPAASDFKKWRTIFAVATITPVVGLVLLLLYTNPNPSAPEPAARRN